MRRMSSGVVAFAAIAVIAAACGGGGGSSKAATAKSAADVGGVPELVSEDAGIGIPAELSWDKDLPADPAAVARGVIDLSRNLPERSRAARRRAVERFDVAPWVARHRP